MSELEVGLPPTRLTAEEYIKACKVLGTIGCMYDPDELKKLKRELTNLRPIAHLTPAPVDTVAGVTQLVNPR